MSPEERQRLLEGGVEQLRQSYAGWSADHVAREVQLLAVQAASIVVPRDLKSIPEAVALACLHADNLLVSPGDHEWDQRVVVGGAGDSVRLRVAPCPSVPLPAQEQRQGGEEEETRLWGQWALDSSSWGSFANVSCLLHAVPRGGRALLFVTGGSAPFPWLLHSVNVRRACAPCSPAALPLGLPPLLPACLLRCLLVVRRCVAVRQSAWVLFGKRLLGCLVSRELASLLCCSAREHCARAAAWRAVAWWPLAWG